MKVLVTGITGFAGSHLAELLLSEGVTVHGIARPRSRTENIDAIAEKIELHEADIRDPYSIRHIISKITPDVIFHLAAQSFVKLSFDAPAETIDTNIQGTLSILEAVRELELVDCVVHIACSSEEYGAVQPEDIPITENTPLRPQSPYAVSKVTCDLLARQYHASYGVKVVITRAFNHTGPRRGDVFATSTFAKQIAKIEKGKHLPVIHHGNLEAMRDWTDVRDVVRGYWLAVRECDYGEPYNICSGNVVSIRTMMRMLLSLSKAEITTKIDATRMRPSDVPILLGEHAKFTEATGWKPEISFDQTLSDLLNYWRERV